MLRIGGSGARGYAWRLVAATAAAASAPALFVPAAGAAVAPTYLRTIGGPGHAEVYAGGVDVDAAGNVYVADTGNDQVEEFAPSGTLVWRQGTRATSPKLLGNFVNPRDVAYLDGKLYVADLGNKRVQVLDAATGSPLTAWTAVLPSPIGISPGVDGSGAAVVLVALPTLNRIGEYTPDGTLVRTFGSGAAGAGAGDLGAPRDAATDAFGNVYVADYGNDRVAKFAPDGTWITSWGGPGGGDSQFRRPYGVAVDAQNRIYVADSTNHRVQVFDAQGTFLAAYGTAGTGGGQFTMLRRVAVQPGVANPDVYLADLWGDKVDRVSQDGSFDFTYAQTFGGVGAPTGLFNQPTGLSVDSSSVYVADSVNQRMQRFDTATGAFQLAWGERGWGSNLSGFNWPRDVTIDSSSTVWVADTKNGRLLEFDTNGNPTGRTFGSLGSGIGQFNRPSAVQPSGTSLVVADSANNRVQLWDMSTPAPTLVWNATGLANPQALVLNGSTVLVADTGNKRLVRLDLASGAQVGSALGVGVLHSPAGIAVDAAGNLWVSDQTSDRLVELAPQGGLLQTLGQLGSAHGQFNQPAGLAILGGDLYVCDVDNDRVEVYQLPSSPTGNTTDTFTGHVDAAGTVSQTFTIPVGDLAASIQASLDWTDASANLSFFLIAPGSSTPVAQATGKTKPKALQYQPLVTGTYKLRVKAVSGASDFTLTATYDNAGSGALSGPDFLSFGPGGKLYG